MPHRATAALLWLLAAAPALAGCLDGGADDDARVTTVDWQVGDRWVYRRTEGSGAESVYIREVTGLFDKRGHEVFEVREGIEGHPIQQRNLYTVDDLRFLGMDVRDGTELLQRLDPVTPLAFHYLLPLPMGTLRQDGTIHQTAGGFEQEDTVVIEASGGRPRDLVLGERVYRVYPYEIRISYTTTPFDDTAVIRGHWAPGIGQSVYTEITESGATRTYELLSFDRVAPRPGGPLYGLVPGLSSQALQRGFEAQLDHPGYARFLFHVEGPTRAAVDFSFPLSERHDPYDTERVELGTIRPLGYARAGIAASLDQVVDDGVVLHLAGAEPGQEPYAFHAPEGDRLGDVRFEPGQVYELLLASNKGGVSARVRFASESQAMAPAERGDLEVIVVNHTRVTAVTPPGPQDIRHALGTVVSLPAGASVEGLVYARNHGGSEAAIGEVNPVRRVLYAVDGEPFEQPEAVYGFYLRYAPPEAFRFEAAYEYRADVAVRGSVDYEVGATLVRLVPLT